ncbi:hypothetical protein SGPA1_30517 [Streptomyces misionensis JCM 4497]
MRTGAGGVVGGAWDAWCDGQEDCERRPPRPGDRCRGPGGPAAGPCGAGGGGRRPGRRRRHRRTGSDPGPVAARHPRRTDQPLAVRRAQGRGRAERAGPVGRHRQGREGVPRLARRGDHPRAAARGRRQGQGSAGRRAQGGGAGGGLPEDDQAGGPAGVRAGRVPHRGSLGDPRGVPGAVRRHRQRSARAGVRGDPAGRGHRGHDRRGRRRALLHRPGRGLQLHGRGPGGGGAYRGGAGGAALVAGDGGGPGDDHQRAGAGRTRDREAVLRARGAPRGPRAGAGDAAVEDRPGAPADAGVDAGRRLGRDAGRRRGGRGREGRGGRPRVRPGEGGRGDRAGRPVARAGIAAPRPRKPKARKPRTPAPALGKGRVPGFPVQSCRARSRVANAGREQALGAGRERMREGPLWVLPAVRSKGELSP